MGQFVDSDGDGLFVWVPDKNNPGEQPPAVKPTGFKGFETTEQDVKTPTTSQTSNQAIGYQSVYSVWDDSTGTVKSFDRTGLRTYVNGLDKETIASWQRSLKSVNKYTGAVNGKLDPDGTLVNGIVDALQYQNQIGATPSKENNLNSAISKYVTDVRSSGFGATSAKPTVSSKDELKAEVNAQFRSMFMVDAPQDVIDSYTQEINNIQVARSTKNVTVKGTVASQEGLSSIERQAILQKYLKQQALRLTDAANAGDTKAKDALQKGAFGATLTKLRNAYYDNGIPISDTSLYTQAIDGSVDETNLNANLNLIKLSAKTYYPALAKQIDAGYSVRQLLTPYIQTRANILEEDPDMIDIKSLSNVASDTGGKLQSLYDYEVSLRQDPKWRFTKNAQDTLSNVALSLGKIFGMVG